MIHERRIEIGQKSIMAINKVVAPKDKKELQSLIGKINFIKRFISNLLGRIEPFSALLKLKPNQEFIWGGTTAEGACKYQEVLRLSTSADPTNERKVFQAIPIGR